MVFWMVSMVFQGGFMVFHGFWLVSMVFQGGFMDFHGFWLVSMVFQGGFVVFHGFWFVSMVLLVENTTKLYPGPTIQSRPCQPLAGFGLVVQIFTTSFILPKSEMAMLHN